MLISYTQSQKGLPTAKPKLEKQSRANKGKNRKDKSIDRKSEKHGKHRLSQVKDGSCIENNTIRLYVSHPLQLKNQLDKVCSPSFFPLLCVVCLTLINVIFIYLYNFCHPVKQRVLVIVGYSIILSTVFCLHAIGSSIQVLCPWEHIKRQYVCTFMSSSNKCYLYATYITLKSILLSVNFFRKGGLRQATILLFASDQTQILNNERERLRLD